MENSGGAEGDAGVDCTVGTIVWVRRRNGSWWPGRILGLEELSASHLMSPRSGTPVKLLGRDDASVDWYNLEKSKRVKAFRCGEFDACIERAEASQGIPIKKREKYARREDAILHALELEKKQVSEKQELGDFSIDTSNKTSGAPKKERNNFSSKVYMRNGEHQDHSKYSSHKAQLVSKKGAASHEEDNLLSSSFTHKGKKCNQFVWEEDAPETLPRMRGLQDFGLRIAPSKKNLSPSPRHVDNHADLLTSDGHSTGGKDVLSIKRKRSQGGTFDESLVKKRDRRRPLVKVLQNIAELPVPHSCKSDYDADVISTECEKDHMTAVFRPKMSRCVYPPADSNDSHNHSGYYFNEMALTEECTSSRLAESTESDSLERRFWEAETEDEANLLTDSTHLLLPGLEGADLSEIQIPEKLIDSTNDVLLSSYMPQLHPHEASKWSMKGKRNVRNLAKRPINAMDENVALISTDKSDNSLKGKSLIGSGQDLYHKNQEFHQTSDLGDQLPQRYPFSSQVDKESGRSQASFNDSDDDSHLDPVFDDNISNGMSQQLINVDLKVQASYQGERVPLVSLMSRLNGKAIIGHPVQIEILGDGSTFQLVPRSEAGLHEGTGPTPVWRTGRRTVMQRVPRPTPTPGGEDCGPLRYSYLSTKSTSQTRRPVLGKNQKKLNKRVSLSSQKTRTLSSIAIDQKARGANINALRGLIKPEDGVPLVTCVPVKVVFSRILEAIGRASTTVAHRVPS